MTRALKSMDGNTAAAHVSYAFTEVAAIYPITPSSVMAELTDKWSANGKKNIFNQPVRISEMQSEGGASGAVHGSLLAGALTTTYTASQGLLLMIPNMYKIAAERLPSVVHVSARTLATHALCIFGDHSDVMSCRSTGYAMLASSNPQQVMDLGAVAHLTAIAGHMPVLHFFDGFRTSHEIQKIGVWDYDDLRAMVDTDALNSFRASALNPNHPVLKGSAQNPDIFFQTREASNLHYDAFPDIVASYMDKVNEKLGTEYKPFGYYGCPDAEYVIIAMGSGCDAIKEVVDYLTGQGEKVGMINVHLYRPFSAKYLTAVLPKTVKKISVLDRTKEPGSIGEPLYLDVIAALHGTEFGAVPVYGGRYGLGSKDTGPACYVAVYLNMMKDEPQHPFTIGIDDDVTHLSLPIERHIDTQPPENKSCKFWGLGSDGTVGANKNSIKIIGDHTDLNVQAYFQYDSKKSGGVTVSHLRFGPARIRSTYYVTESDFVACHNAAYLEKYPMAQDCKPNGIFLINCNYDLKTLDKKLPAEAKRYIAANHVQVYTIDAVGLGEKLGLGNKYNSILQSAFFKLTDIIPIADAVKYMKDAIVASYGHKGDDVINMNFAAVDAGLDNIVKIDVPESWMNPAPAKHPAAHFKPTGNDALDEFATEIQFPSNAMLGDTIPVSKTQQIADGTLPQGSAAFEKRGIATQVPAWIPDNCVQCNRCAFVCPHSVIRPFVLDGKEFAAAPEDIKAKRMNGKGMEKYYFSIIPSVMDCTGCGSCVNVCPAKNKALEMLPLNALRKEQASFDYAVAHYSEKKVPYSRFTVKGSQFQQPLFEFSGACAGCGETPYAKLVTQLFGERMMIANATGCSSIWGGSAPTTPYTVNHEGKGPAWANSLFEDNAEFGLGMKLAVEQRRAKLIDLISKLLADEYTHTRTRAAAQAWFNSMDNGPDSLQSAKKLEAQLLDDGSPAAMEIYSMRDLFPKPSVWIFGGDGWAYDIGYGGVDHVLASGKNVNLFVFDTEVYSNTGGQASKATPTGAVAQFTAAGKELKKKDLAQIAMAYGYVYVAQIAMGADYQQTVQAIQEAEAYPGPSLIIAYSPCINHGAKAGMGKSQETMKRAVEAGYWHLFRFDPRKERPFHMDSGEPSANYNDYIMSEVRYSSLNRTFPDRARKLFAEAEVQAKEKYEHLVKLERTK
ncbi:MAG: pyruvate:ferredoxin (flavodoxin) oxidoreductase [Oscillospiraceae bacterium]|nr:pyruvate:ferredoxin (flavodoxin) oxidoreductase [Oscillospiraceae bacterium]